MRRALPLLLAAIAVPVTSFFVGVNSGADSLRAKQAAAASKIEAVEPGPLKQQVIEREVIKIKTEKVYIHPESCARAVQLAVEALAETDKFLSTATEIQEVSRLLAKAIVLEEVQVLIKARNDLREHQNATLDNVFKLGDISSLLSQYSTSCEEELADKD